jgi:SAM-dependent methyltransferase
MSDRFYRAFEERYRGSRELVKSRLEAYLPFVKPLQEYYPGASAVDIGCGRGEWLEVLASAGFQPHGIDLDQDMLQACIEHGLAVVQGDAIAYLSAQPDESQAVVSAFHVVEHISFDQLRSLVSEAMRVLKPGGLLIMETPNPENIVVATRNFYLDPTHQRPLPPDLLAFLPEYYGFAYVKTIRLQETKELHECDRLGLLDVLAGASPDYAVIAQKQGSKALMLALAPLFSMEFGLNLDTLTSRYDHQRDMTIEQSETRAQQAEVRAQQLENVYTQLGETKVKQAVQDVTLAEQQAHSHWLQNEWDATKARLEHLIGEHALSQARVEALTNQLTETQATLAARDVALAEQQTYSQSLQNERDAVKARLERLVGNLALSQARMDGLESQLTETQATLAARDGALAEQQAHSQWLQNEWDSVKARLEYLVRELTLSQARENGIESQLAETQTALAARDATLAEQQAHSQWLQKELDNAKAKIDELNHSSHHWWTVSDQFNRELQAIYKSKFWKITWPLRKLMLLLKWLVFLPIRLLRWTISIPKRMARWLLTKAMTFTIRRPGLSMRVSHWLNNYPKLKHHLRLFAQNRGLIHIFVDNVTVTSVHSDLSTPDLSSMTPRARQIYADLKTLVEQSRRFD